MGEISRIGLSHELWLVVLAIFLSYAGYDAVLPIEIIYLLGDGHDFTPSPPGASPLPVAERSP